MGGAEEKPNFRMKEPQPGIQGETMPVSEAARQESLYVICKPTECRVAAGFQW